MKKTDKAIEHNWDKADSMTEAEVLNAAKGDPDSIPLSDLEFRNVINTPRARIIRRALNLSQEEFAAQYHIPVGTLRDWEQGRTEPDQAAKAYLTVIANAPLVVTEALGKRH